MSSERSSHQDIQALEIGIAKSQGLLRSAMEAQMMVLSMPPGNLTIAGMQQERMKRLIAAARHELKLALGED